MTEQEEEFVHFTSCIEALNNAWRILTKIKEGEGNSLVGPAFRFALIEYSKPYKQSRGTKRRALGTEYIPDELINLHNRIIGARDQIHAHSDLTVMGAKLYFHKIDGQRHYGIVKNHITGLEEYKNRDEIQGLIEKTLDNMYKKEVILMDALTE